jgi:hypothetical protein
MGLLSKRPCGVSSLVRRLVRTRVDLVIVVRIIDMQLVRRYSHDGTFRGG